MLPLSLVIRVVSAPVGIVAPGPLVLEGEGPLLIGRGGNSVWILPDSKSDVSREHAEIAASEGRWVLTDRSSNGTWVDGRTLRRGAQADLVAGSQIALGDYLLRVEAPAADGDAAFEQPADDGAVRVPDRALDEVGDVFDRQDEDASRPEPDNWFNRHEGDLGKLIAQDLKSIVPLSDPAQHRRTDDVGDVGDVGPVAEPPDPPRPVGDGGDDEAIQAFLAGAGLAGLPDGVSAGEAMHAAGASLRILIEALASLLAARAALKGEFRLQRTELGSAGNNPMKFTSDVGEMMQFALGMQRQGYLGGGNALAEAGRDIAIHQLAMVTAFRALIAALFKELSPSTVAKAVNDDLRGLGRLVPGRIEAEQWNRFAATYAALATDFGQSFDGRLGRLFAGAYEETADREAGAARRR